MPSSKSHTIRALLIAGTADGAVDGAADSESTIINALDSADARSCIAALEQLGVTVTVVRRHATGMDLRVGPPPGGMLRRGTNAPRGDRAPVAIDVGNSGTTLYLLSALAAHRPEGVCFDGDASIRGRSAGKLLDALKTLGAGVRFENTAAEGCAPYCVSGPLSPGQTVAVESPTSQYLSAILLTVPLITAAPSATATPTVITVPLLNEHPYIDMTCWWLDRQQITYTRDGYRRFTIPPGQSYRPFTATLPGDYSSATFWFCAAAITGAPVTVSGLLPDDVQGDRRVLDILTELGCSAVWNASDGAMGGPSPGTVASVTVSGRPLRGGRFDLNAMPDALPALAVLACSAPEPIALVNVPQARQKETDRIAVMAAELGKLGAVVRELPDGLEIEPGVLRGGHIESHGDHRIAMAFAVAALAASGPVTIGDAGAAAVTYPSFFFDLAALAPGSVAALPAGREA